jgi:hypothetical protein
MTEELARQQPCQGCRYRALGDHESPLPQSVNTPYGGRSAPANCSVAQVECLQFHALYGGRLEFHTVMIPLAAGVYAGQPNGLLARRVHNQPSGSSALPGKRAGLPGCAHFLIAIHYGFQQIRLRSPAS